MGFELKRIHVELPNDLVEFSGGVKVVTCRYLGKRQQGKIALDQFSQQKENRGSQGEDWLIKMSRVAVNDSDELEAHRARLDKKKEEDPVEWALDRWPDDLVCKHAIKAFDGTDVDANMLVSWLEDGLHPDVTRHIAVAVLTASHLIPETKGERGEDLGVLSVA